MMRTLYEQTNFPVLQNRVYETREAAINCVRGDIHIVEDHATGLIYNAAFRSELMVYDANYNNEQGLSAFFQTHLGTVAGIIERDLGRERLVEVGCGKGFFFEMLLADGFDVTGFDPTYEGNNPRIVKEYFRPGVMQPSRALILRHVLEHVPDPYDFLCQLRDANGGSGLVYIEVPCFDWICENRAWFDIFYEHVNYFRMADFEKMFGRLVSSGRLFGNQYLYVVGDLATLTRPKFTKETTIQFPSHFLEVLNSAEQSRALVWGGASKGVIFSLLRARIGMPVDAVIDVNPAKQGRFLPATGLKVQSPEDALELYPAGTTVYVMNSNYLDEIRAMTGEQFMFIAIDQGN